MIIQCGSYSVARVQWLSAKRQLECMDVLNDIHEQLSIYGIVFTAASSLPHPPITLNTVDTDLHCMSVLLSLCSR